MPKILTQQRARPISPTNIDIKLDRLNGLTVKIPFHNLKRDNIKCIELEINKALIKLFGGNMSTTARFIGVSKNTLHKRLLYNGY